MHGCECKRSAQSDKKELRKISKSEMLEIMLSQAKRIEELENELNKTKKKLESKKILIDECGTLAEASLKLNGIFETAQQSAELYLLNVKDKCKRIEENTRKECLLKTEKMIADTEEICKKRQSEIDEYLKKVKKVKNGKGKVTSKNKISKINNNEVDKNSDVKDGSGNKEIKTKQVVKGRPVKTIKKRNIT